MKGLEDEPRRSRNFDEEKKERKPMRGARKRNRNRRAVLAWQAMRATDDEGWDRLMAAVRRTGAGTPTPIWK